MVEATSPGAIAATDRADRRRPHLAQPHNRLTFEAPLGLIGNVHAALATIGNVHAALATIGVAPAGAETATPAAPVKKSVFADHTVCAEDGQKLKALKRHLMATRQMTPEQ